MAEPISTPRVNSTYLESFVNHTVRITGKVVQLRGELATIDANGNVTAHLNRVRFISDLAFREITVSLYPLLFPSSWAAQCHNDLY